MIKLPESYIGKEENFFEKLDVGGNLLDFKMKRADGVRVIHDKNTGLYWEVKSNDKNDVNFCKDKYAFGELDTYVKKLNDAKYGGFDDWRIPNKDELRSIVDYGLDDIAINTDIFENCQIGDYQTKNTYNMQPYFNWVIFFGLGSGIAKSKKTKRYVIACRGGKERLFGETDAARFVDNGDGTVTDTSTGIMWQKGENERMNVFDAAKKCAEMDLGGYTDWRLPNIKELNTILNLDYCDGWWYFKDIFPAEGLNPPLLHYFSSSEFKNKYAWVTNFCFGYDGYYGGKNAPLLFRACRTAESENQKYLIPHTGETAAYDVEGNPISVDEKSEYFGLDCSRVTNKMSFDFVKEQNACVDRNTGLMWQIHSAEQNKVTYYEAEKYIEELNSRMYLGFNDWRIPSREELRSIVNYDDCIPAIDTDIFADTQCGFYWAKEFNKAENGSAWGIYFVYGCAISYPKETKGYIRAVRGRNVFEAPIDKRYIDNNDGTVTDKSLGIMWAKEETPLLTLKAALKYCRDLRTGGYDDWTLPNMKELGSLINLKETENEWFIKSLFPNTNTKPQGFYMSSTTFDGTFGWGCNFQFGFDGYYADRKSGKYPFRPVRKISESDEA